VIWAVAFNAGEGSPAVGAHIASNNRNRYRPAAAAEALYDPGHDVRFPAYFARRSLSGTPRGFSTSTTAARTSADNLVNWKVTRTGEMYLIRAEARALQPGKQLAALEDLNALRAARITLRTRNRPGRASPGDAIATERRKELFGEGHRWFDLKRTTRTIDRGTDCGAGSAECTLAPEAREWTWPIPQLEVDSNPSIGNQQTTGY
jgi:hypothetical protein